MLLWEQDTETREGCVFNILMQNPCYSGPQQIKTDTEGTRNQEGCVFNILMQNPCYSGSRTQKQEEGVYLIVLPRGTYSWAYSQCYSILYSTSIFFTDSGVLNIILSMGSLNFHALCPLT